VDLLDENYNKYNKSERLIFQMKRYVAIFKFLIDMNSVIFFNQQFLEIKFL